MIRLFIFWRGRETSVTITYTMKVLLTQVTEPQICFPADDGGTICNWVEKGIYAISSKNGWMKIPPNDPVVDEDAEEVEEYREKEEDPSLAATGSPSEI